MMLSSRDIIREMNEGRIEITPFYEGQLGPNSYDICLGGWSVPLVGYNDEGAPVYGDFTAHNPGDLLVVDKPMLVMSREIIGSRSDIVPRLVARSSVVRGGVLVSPSAGFGDVGYINHWTATLIPTLYTDKSAMLVVGNPFAQIVFYRTETTPVEEYKGQYAARDWPLCMIPGNQRKDYTTIVYEDRPVIRRLQEVY
jgi:deoxycytidine triphosphate deaminase